MMLIQKHQIGSKNQFIHQLQKEDQMYYHVKAPKSTRLLLQPHKYKVNTNSRFLSCWDF